MTNTTVFVDLPRRIAWREMGFVRCMGSKWNMKVYIHCLVRRKLSAAVAGLIFWNH